MEEYLNRRKKLLEKLPDNSIVISFSGNEIRQSADEAIKFTPDYSFFYLTGIKQASTILLMSKNSIMSDEYLFIQTYNSTNYILNLTNNEYTLIDNYILYSSIYKNTLYN